MERCAQSSECLMLFVDPLMGTAYHNTDTWTHEQHSFIAKYAIRISLNRLQVFRGLGDDLGNIT